MTLTKKLSIAFIVTLALASFLMITTPTHAGFFDWLFGKNVSQEASVMKATATTKAVAPVTTTPAKTTTTIAVSTALRIGSESAEVAKLQADLTKLGYYTGKIDSKFGPQLHAAVVAYQRAQGLTADGVAGSGTKARLGWGSTWGGVDKVVTPGVGQPLPVTSDYIDVVYFKDMCLVIFDGGDSYEWGTYSSSGPDGCTTGSGTYRVSSYGDVGYHNAVLSSLIKTLTVSPQMKDTMERIAPAPEHSPFGTYWKYRKFGDQCQRILIYTTGSNATPSNDGWVAC